MRLVLKEQRALGFKAREAGAQLCAGELLEWLLVPQHAETLGARMAWKLRRVSSWRPEGPLGHQGAAGKNRQKAFVFHSTPEA